MLQLVLQLRQLLQDYLAFFSLQFIVNSYNGPVNIIDYSCLARSAYLRAPCSRLTKMTGQRSRAEMKANDVRSEVAYGAIGASGLDPI